MHLETKKDPQRRAAEGLESETSRLVKRSSGRTMRYPVVALCSAQALA